MINRIIIGLNNVNRIKDKIKSINLLKKWTYIITEVIA